MIINTTSIHFDADQKLLDYIEKKTTKLDQFFDRIIDAQVFLKLEIRHDRIRFLYSPDGERWTAAGWEQDASILSDEHTVPCAFTGNFVGMACQDLTGLHRHADFDWFEYRVLDA